MGGATSGVLGASVDTGVPVVFNVLTCDTMEQVGCVGFAGQGLGSIHLYEMHAFFWRGEGRGGGGGGEG